MSAFDDLREIGNKHNFLPLLDYRESIVPNDVANAILGAANIKNGCGCMSDTEPWKITQETLDNFHKSLEGNQSNYMTKHSTYHFDVHKLKPEMFIKVTYHKVTYHSTNKTVNGIILDVNPTKLKFIFVSDSGSGCEACIFADSVLEGRYSFEIVGESPKTTDVHNIHVKLNADNFVTEVIEQLKKKGMLKSW